MILFRKKWKTPTVLQMEATECGAAALGIILEFYGLTVPLEELRIACGVSRDGSKAINMVKAARKYGMNAIGAEADIDVLKEQKYPFIVFWQFNHFVVVELITKNKVYLNDPALGRYTLSLAEFNHFYTGVLLLIEPGPEFRTGGVKKTVWRSLFERLRGTGFDLTFIVLVSLASVVPNVLISGSTKIFIDEILVRGIHHWLPVLVIGIFITASLRALLSYLERKALLHLQVKSLFINSTQFLWHVFKLPMLFFDQRYAGDIEERISANDRIASMLSSDVTENIVGLISIGFYGIVLFFLSWKLTLLGISSSLINFILLYYISRQLSDKSFQYLQVRGKLSSAEINGIQAIETLKSGAQEDQFFQRWAGLHAKNINLQQKLGLLDQLLSTLPSLLRGLINLLILGIGSLQIISGELTIGTLVAFQSLLSSFNAPLMMLLNSGSQIQEIKGDIARLEDVLRHPIDARSELPIKKNRSLTKKALTLEFKNITFGYSPLEVPLIEKLNFTLTPGKQIALVGKTGSGKSTIAKLVTGLYQPWAGEILLNGNPLSKISREVLSPLIAFVDQDIFLFEGTVQENLTLWTGNIPKKQLEQAIMDADVNNLLKSRLDYLNTPVLEGGVNFSGGERQRLDIARALVKNPVILVLDEATASLDALCEEKIIQNLKERGLSLLIIAHRLSTIRYADEIIVLDSGKVVERGTHKELIDNSRHYHEFIVAGQL